MLSRWRGGIAAVVVTLVACVLVILDLTDGGLRRWWDGHAWTTDSFAGLFVLLITVLVIDQVVRLRQINNPGPRRGSPGGHHGDSGQPRVAGGVPGKGRLGRPGSGAR